MAQPVVHFEITGKDPEALRRWFAKLFAWEFDVTSRVAEGISDPDSYGFVAPGRAGDVQGIPGGIGGGPQYARHDLLRRRRRRGGRARPAEELGGTRVFGPARAPSGLVVGHLADPEGNLVGLAALPG